MHGPGHVTDGQTPRGRGDRSPRRPLICSGHSRIVEPADGITVEVGLLDGLWRTDTVQLRRAIGGDHDHRHARLMRLDDCRVEVGGRRAAGAQQQRQARRSPEPTPSAANERAALVVEDVHLDVDPVGKRQRHRRTARTRGEHRVAQPETNPLVDQCCAERRLHVLRQRGHGRHHTGLSSTLCAPTSRSRSGPMSSARGATSASVGSRPPSPLSPTRSTSTSCSGPTSSTPRLRPARPDQSSTPTPRSSAGPSGLGRSSITSPPWRQRAGSSSAWIAPCGPTPCSPIGCCGSPEHRTCRARMKERLLQAYFIDGLDIGDPEVLATCADEVGLDHDRVLAFLDSDDGLAEVQRRVASGVGAGDHRRADIRVRRPVDGARGPGPRHVRPGAASRRRQPHGRCLTGDPSRPGAGQVPRVTSSSPAGPAGRVRGWSSCTASPRRPARGSRSPPVSPPTATRRSSSMHPATAAQQMSTSTCAEEPTC